MKNVHLNNFNWEPYIYLVTNFNVLTGPIFHIIFHDIFLRVAFPQFNHALCAIVATVKSIWSPPLPVLILCFSLCVSARTCLIQNCEDFFERLVRVSPHTFPLTRSLLQSNVPALRLWPNAIRFLHYWNTCLIARLLPS